MISFASLNKEERQLKVNKTIEKKIRKTNNFSYMPKNVSINPSHVTMQLSNENNYIRKTRLIILISK